MLSHENRVSVTSVIFIAPLPGIERVRFERHQIAIARRPQPIIPRKGLSRGCGAWKRGAGTAFSRQPDRGAGNMAEVAIPARFEIETRDFEYLRHGDTALAARLYRPKGE